MNASISIADAEGALIDTLISTTGNRRYGTADVFGATASATVTIA